MRETRGGDRHEHGRLFEPSRPKRSGAPAQACRPKDGERASQRAGSSKQQGHRYPGLLLSDKTSVGRGGGRKRARPLFEPWRPGEHSGSKPSPWVASRTIKMVRYPENIGADGPAWRWLHAAAARGQKMYIVTVSIGRVRAFHNSQQAAA